MFKIAMIILLMNRSLAMMIVLATIPACKSRPVAPIVDEGVAVARVGDKIITDKEFISSIDIIKTKFPRQFESYPEKKSLLEQLINVELLYQAAKLAGLDRELEFKTRLANLYVEKISEQARSQITDGDLLNFYKANARSLDQVSARHILVKPEDRALLEKIRAELTSQPEKFPALAKKHSTDSSADRGGDLGFFSYEMMVEPFSQAAFALKKSGDLSPLVATPFGLHLIQLTGDRRGFEANRAATEKLYSKKTQSETFDRELSRLRKNQRIEIYEEALIGISPLPEIMQKDPSETMRFNAPSSPRQ